MKKHTSNKRNLIHQGRWRGGERGDIPPGGEEVGEEDDYYSHVYCVLCDIGVLDD